MLSMQWYRLAKETHVRAWSARPCSCVRQPDKPVPRLSDPLRVDAGHRICWSGKFISLAHGKQRDKHMNCLDTNIMLYMLLELSPCMEGMR